MATMIYVSDLRQADYAWTEKQLRTVEQAPLSIHDLMDYTGGDWLTVPHSVRLLVALRLMKADRVREWQQRCIKRIFFPVVDTTLPYMDVVIALTRKSKAATSLLESACMSFRATRDLAAEAIVEALRVVDLSVIVHTFAQYAVDANDNNAEVINQVTDIFALWE